MTVHRIEEHDINGVDGPVLNARVLADNNDGTSLIEIRDAGVLARAGQHHTVPTSALRRG